MRANPHYKTVTIRPSFSLIEKIFCTLLSVDTCNHLIGLMHYPLAFSCGFRITGRKVPQATSTRLQHLSSKMNNSTARLLLKLPARLLLRLKRNFQPLPPNLFDLANFSAACTIFWSAGAHTICQTSTHQRSIMTIMSLRFVLFLLLYFAKFTYWSRSKI